MPDCRCAISALERGQRRRPHADTVRALSSALDLSGATHEALLASARASLTPIRLLRDQFAFLYALVPLAAATALKGDDVWVARLLGARAAVAELTDAAVVDDYLRDRLATIERDAKARLGVDRWMEAHTEGRTISFDALSKDIDLTL